MLGLGLGVNFNQGGVVISTPILSVNETTITIVLAGRALKPTLSEIDTTITINA